MLAFLRRKNNAPGRHTPQAPGADEAVAAECLRLLQSHGEALEAVTGELAGVRATLARDASPPGALRLPKARDEIRRLVAETYLAGHGLEIGAFASPLGVPPAAKVAYVDKYRRETLDASFTVAGLTLADFGLTPEQIIQPDIVDDGETLIKVGDFTQDFVIANHVLEHFEDPIRGFKNMLRVLRHGGILYLSLPEMRHSFDRVRAETPFAHLLRDHLEGPANSRDTAYREFAEIFVHHGIDKGLFERRTGHEKTAFIESVAAELNAKDFSIHFHAWTTFGMLDMFSQIRKMPDLHFDMEVMLQNEDEVIFVFRKQIAHKTPDARVTPV